MSTRSALALANHLATTLPRDGQSYDDYLRGASSRWPDLSASEIEWAMQRATVLCRRDAGRLLTEADELERHG